MLCANSAMNATEIFDSSIANTKIQRYMDLSQFVDLIQKRRLFFASKDHFEDKLDSAKLPLSYEPDPAIKRVLEDSYSLKIRASYISCWHKSDRDSHLMWKSYAAQPTSLYIETSTDKLWAELNEYPVRIAESVVYGGSKKGFFSDFLVKRLEFRGEEEIRFLVFDMERPDKPGVHVLVDPKRFIERIRVSPYAKPWQVEVIRNLSSHFGLAKSIVSQTDYLYASCGHH